MPICSDQRYGTRPLNPKSIACFPSIPTTSRNNSEEICFSSFAQSYSSPRLIAPSGKRARITCFLILSLICLSQSIPIFAMEPVVLKFAMISKENLGDSADEISESRWKIPHEDQPLDLLHYESTDPFNEGILTFTLFANESSISENSGPITVTVTAEINNSQRYSTEQTLLITVSGSGNASAVDFAPVTDFNIVIPANSRSGSATFTLTPTDDSVDEDTETVTISSTSNLVTVTDAITILDDDPTPTGINLDINPEVAQEDEGNQVFTVTATVVGTTTYGQPQTIPITISGTLAATAVDFTPVNGFDIQIPGGSQSGSGFFTITPEDDVVDEDDETITVASTIELVTNLVTFLLRDDDDQPRGINLQAIPNVAYEDLGRQRIEIVADISGSTTYATDQLIPLTVTGTGADGVVGFAPVSSFDITLPAESTSSRQDFFLIPTNNLLDEQNETITISSSSQQVTESIVFNLIDDDPTPEITLRTTPSSIDESNGATPVTIIADWDTDVVFVEDQVIPLSITGSGIPSAVDFTSISSSRLTISAGESSGKTTFTLTPINDTLDEADETITVASNSPLIKDGATATIKLLDNDDPPGEIVLSAAPSILFENDGVTAITVTAAIGNNSTFATSQSITINVTGSGNDNVVEFTSPSNFSINFPPGQSIASSTLILTPIDDDVPNQDEEVTLSSDDPAVTGSTNITLINDDSTPSILLKVNPNSIYENAGATSVTLTASLQESNQLDRDLRIPISVNESGLEGAVDFTPVSGFDLILIGGQSTVSTTFTIIPTNDSHDESDEIISIKGNHPWVFNSPIITLVDDDESPTIRLTATPNSINENDGAREIIVTASLMGMTQFGSSQILPISVSGSGREDAVDFIPVDNFDLVIPSGSLNGTSRFTLTPEDDLLKEVNEVISIKSSSLLVTEIATVLLRDNDHSEEVQISIDPKIIYEERGPQTIKLAGTPKNGLTFSQNQVITLSARGSGVPTAVDFEPIPDIILELKAGLQSVTANMVITPINDLEFESDETLTLSSVDGSIHTLSDIRLINDDEEPEGVIFSVSPDKIQEDSGSITVTLTATIQGNSRYSQNLTLPLIFSGTSDDPTTVGYHPITSDDLLILAGSSQGTVEFEIIPINDLVQQSDGTITISSPSDRVIGDATIALKNDDVATGIALSVDPESILESSGSTSITLTAEIQGRVTYSTDQTLIITTRTSGEASAVDFTSIPEFELTIPAQSSTAITKFDLVPEDDDLDEQDEILTFGSSSPLVIQQATLMIVDDDSTPEGILLSLSPNVLPENSGEIDVTVTVRIDGETQFAVDKLLKLTATGSDLPEVVGYTLFAPSTLLLSAGENSATTTFQISPVDNRIDERDATVTISVSDDEIMSSADLLLIDDDSEPSGFTLSVSPDLVSEGDGPTIVNVTASLTGDSRYAAVQTLNVSVDEPIAGTVGYEAIPDFNLRVPAGAESGRATFTLIPLENNTLDTDATITIIALHQGQIIRTTLLLQDDDQSTQRAMDVNAVLLPETGRAIITSSVGAIGDRIRMFSGRPLNSQGDFIRGLSSIAMSLNNYRSPTSSIEPLSVSRPSQASLSTRIYRKFSLWTHVNRINLSGNSDRHHLDYDGKFNGVHIGVDVSLGQVLVGVSVARFGGDFNYSYLHLSNGSEPTDPISGIYQVKSQTITPYMSWAWSSRSKVWGMVILGLGDLIITDPDLSREEANTSLGSYAAGVDFHIIPAKNRFTLIAKGAAWGGQIDAERNLSRISEHDARIYRIQMSIEGAYRVRLSDNGLLQPFVETGFRRDGGGGLTGTGLELVGGVRFFLPSIGLRLTGRGYVLVAHEGSVTESGFSGTLRYSPGGNTGPILELGSIVGNQFNGKLEIWEASRWLTQNKRSKTGSQFRSRLGYGFSIKPGTVTPYTAIEYGHGLTAQVGSEFSLGSGIRIRMETMPMYIYHREGYSPAIRAVLIKRL